MKTLIFLIAFILLVGLVNAQNPDNNENDQDKKELEQAAKKVIAVRENDNLSRLDKLFKEADIVASYALGITALKRKIKERKENDEHQSTETD